MAASCPILEYHCSFIVILMFGSATNTISISMSTAICLSRSCAARLLFRFICIVFIGFMISRCTSFLSDCKSSASGIRLEEVPFLPPPPLRRRTVGPPPLRLHSSDPSLLLLISGGHSGCFGGHLKCPPPPRFWEGFLPPLHSYPRHLPPQPRM
jgi:hypothetical protein